MLGSAPGPRLRGAEPLAAAGSVCVLQIDLR